MAESTSALRTAGADIRVVAHEDTILVRLHGELDHGCLDELSDALLPPHPTGRRQVVVEAGYVDSATPAVLAVLLKAADRALSSGGRLVFATLSWPLLELVRAHGVHGELPHLPGPNSPARVGRPGLTQLPC